jgi:hypothetical protein
MTVLPQIVHVYRLTYQYRKIKRRCCPQEHKDTSQKDFLIDVNWMLTAVQSNWLSIEQANQTSLWGKA